MKPILFNTDMVKAILDGRKTVTRRAIKPRYRDDEYGFMVIGDDATGERHVEKYDEDEGSFYPCRVVNPPYQIGDILYVRETWKIGAWKHIGGLIAVDYKADNFPRCEWIQTKDLEIFEKYWIQSTEDALKADLSADEKGEYHWKPGEAPTRWRPAIHMPKDAARIFLKVTDVKIQRLQHMDSEDAVKEGMIDPYTNGKYFSHEPMKDFIPLWDSTIKESDIEEYGWEANPWVWVIEFEKIEKPNE